MPTSVHTSLRRSAMHANYMLQTSVHGVSTRVGDIMVSQLKIVQCLAIYNIYITSALYIYKGFPLGSASCVHAWPYSYIYKLCSHTDIAILQSARVYIVAVAKCLLYIRWLV